MEVEPQDGACPSCGARTDEGTQSFPTVMPGASEISAAPAVHTEPVLVVEKGPEVGERFVIDRNALSMGRDPASDIFLNDVTVSRKHAGLSFADGVVTLRDVGSLNGTYVNGIRVDEAVLRHGDAVQVGRFQMVFLAGGAG